MGAVQKLWVLWKGLSKLLRLILFINLVILINMLNINRNRIILAIT